eukprot:Gb_30585 [translate_table: standard]
MEMSPEIEIQAASIDETHISVRKKHIMFRVLLLLNCLCLTVGLTAGPLLLRLYFVHGGSRRWLTSWLQTAGWPVLILPLMVSYYYSKDSNAEGNHVSVKLIICSSGVGVLTGLDNYMYVWGVSYLPASTSALLISTQLAFNALFVFILVSHKFTPYSINSVILLTLGSILLVFHTSSDRPEGVTNGQYVLGFLLTIGAAALYGFILPLIELIYKKTKCKLTYTLAMEMQVIMSFTATVFCTIGMVVNKDFQAIHREAKAFGLGELNYYMTLVWSSIVWQLFFIGVFGVIFLTTSFLSGVLIAVGLPLTEILSVIIFHDKFNGEKGMAMVLALWGFASYLYGEYKLSKLQPTEIINPHEEQQLRPIPLSEDHTQPLQRSEGQVELIVEETCRHTPKPL